MSTYQPYGGYNGGDYNGGDYNAGGFDNQGSSQPRAPTKSSLIPVTIKQINDSKQTIQDGDFVVNNMELNQVSFIGVIRSVIDNASSLQINVEDGTGSIDVRKWISDDPTQQEDTSFLVDRKYVHISGSIKEFNGKKNIQHPTFREITDFNQVLYHHLSAIDAHITAKGLVSANSSNSAQQNPLFVSNPTSAEAGTSISDRIYEFIAENTPSMTEGVPINFIAQSLNLLAEDVVLYCGKLTEEARIYAGYDENGFLAV